MVEPGCKKNTIILNTTIARTQTQPRASETQQQHSLLDPDLGLVPASALVPAPGLVPASATDPYDFALLAAM